MASCLLLSRSTTVKNACSGSTAGSEGAARNIQLLRIANWLSSVWLCWKTPLIPRPMDAVQKERREREIAEILMRFRTFAERSKWKKARISRELGVSLSTVDRWLAGHDKILLASMLAIGFWRSGSNGRLCFWRGSAGCESNRAIQ